MNVAGEGRDELIAVVRELLASRRLISVDFLGENTTDRAQADATAAEYLLSDPPPRRTSDQSHILSARVGEQVLDKWLAATMPPAHIPQAEVHRKEPGGLR